MKSPLFATNPCGHAWTLNSENGDRMVLFPDGSGRVWLEEETASGGYAMNLPPGLRAFIFAAATVAEVTLEARVNARDGSDLILFMIVQKGGVRPRRFAWTPCAITIEDADALLSRDSEIDDVIYHAGGNRLLSRDGDSCTLSEFLTELLHEACEVDTEASTTANEP